ncbi:hypothetical protein DFH11DRAFT_1571692 [Phellopilus nigrolimitatus]|nr:hypothetical protein DFH11DRAFT_1571692 [Phellopilus nigrolimitatus]
MVRNVFLASLILPSAPQPGGLGLYQITGFLVPPPRPPPPPPPPFPYHQSTGLFHEDSSPEIGLELFLPALVTQNNVRASIGDIIDLKLSLFLSSASPYAILIIPAIVDGSHLLSCQDRSNRRQCLV